MERMTALRRYVDAGKNTGVIIGVYEFNEFVEGFIVPRKKESRPAQYGEIFWDAEVISIWDRFDDGTEAGRLKAKSAVVEYLNSEVAKTRAECLSVAGRILKRFSQETIEIMRNYYGWSEEEQANHIANRYSWDEEWMQEVAERSDEAFHKWEEGGFRRWLLENPIKAVLEKLPLEAKTVNERAVEFYGKYIFYPSTRTALSILQLNEVELEALCKEKIIPQMQEQMSKLIKQGLISKGFAVTGGEKARDSSAPNVFREERGVWTLRYNGGNILYFPDRKGFKYISFLLAHPIEEFPVCDLYFQVEGRPPDLPRDVSEVSDVLDVESGENELTVVDSARGIEQIDRKTMRDVRQKLQENKAEREEAERNNDLARIQSLDDETRNLQEYLNQSLERTGRPRLSGDPSERSRLSVSKVIRDAIGTIRQKDSQLAQHLENCVKLGRNMSYRPDRTTQWVS